jgi:hypothetical protein
MPYYIDTSGKKGRKHQTQFYRRSKNRTSKNVLVYIFLVYRYFCRNCITFTITSGLKVNMLFPYLETNLDVKHVTGRALSCQTSVDNIFKHYFISATIAVIDTSSFTDSIACETSGYVRMSCVLLLTSSVLDMNIQRGCL